MKSTTYIIIGLAAIIATSTGLLIRFLVKSGADGAKIKAHEDKAKLLTERNSLLENLYAKTVEDLLKELQNSAKFAAREKIYQEKIQVDSLLLEEIKESNERIDSIIAGYSLDDWNKFIATDISEN